MIALAFVLAFVAILVTQYDLEAGVLTGCIAFPYGVMVVIVIPLLS